MAISESKLSLQEQVGIVTGGGRGIGRAIALALAAAGMHVVVAARSRREIDATVAEVIKFSGSAEAMAVDVRDRSAVEACVARVLTSRARIDLLINNAGSNIAIGPVWETDADAWRQDVEVNLFGPFLFCRAVLPAMIARRQGRIINILGGGVTGPLPYDTGYASSKAGLARFTESVAIEARPWGVKVFPMRPGAVRTDLSTAVFESPAGRRWNPALKSRMEGRWTSSEAAAKLSVALASGRADALTGRLIDVYDDLDALIARADELREHDLHTLRVVTATSGHVPAVMLTALEEQS